MSSLLLSFVDMRGDQGAWLSWTAKACVGVAQIFLAQSTPAGVKLKGHRLADHGHQQIV